MTGLHRKRAAIGDEFVTGKERVHDFHLEW